MFSKCRLQCAKYTKNNKPSSSLSEIALEISACRSESDMLRNAQVTVLVITLERSIIRQLAVLRVQFFHNSANLFIYNTITTTFLPIECTFALLISNLTIHFVDCWITFFYSINLIFPFLTLFSASFRTLFPCWWSSLFRVVLELNSVVPKKMRQSGWRDRRRIKRNSHSKDVQITFKSVMLQRWMSKHTVQHILQRWTKSYP